jgi:UDP-glucose 6-dehydrogenase
VKCRSGIGARITDFGHQVTRVDKETSKVARLRQGGILIFEPALEGLITSKMRTGYLLLLSADRH